MLSGYNNETMYFSSLGLFIYFMFFTVPSLWAATVKPAKVTAIRTPPGLSACTQGALGNKIVREPVGESIRYYLDINGLQNPEPCV